MAKLERLTQEDRDNLTAYLDGELEEDATRRIESILANSAVARTDVEALARTYELLDSLPRPTAPEDFTERTVATAKLEKYHKPLIQQPLFRTLQRTAVLVGWSAALLAAATYGFALTNRWVPREEDGLLRDFALIRDLDLYSEAKDVEFLQELAGQKQLLDEIRGGTTR
jgi:anti-sigma factor RsiW